MPSGSPYTHETVPSARVRNESSRFPQRTPAAVTSYGPCRKLPSPSMIPSQVALSFVVIQPVR